MANPYFNDAYVEAFYKTGAPMFEQGRRGMVEMVRSLKKGGIIAIVSDLHAQGGEELMFFGKPAVTSVLNAELAIKYNAVLIPCYAVRQPNGIDFEIVLHEPVPHTDAKTMTQFTNDDLEKDRSSAYGAMVLDSPPLERLERDGRSAPRTCPDHLTRVAATIGPCPTR